MAEKKAPTYEQLEKENAELKKLVDELNAENKKLANQLEALSEKAGAAGIHHTCEHKGEKYTFTVPSFYLPATQTQYTAQEAAENADVIKLLVESNSPVLTKQD
jgi:predicted nuclease with TOPRIM domain